MKTLIYTIVVVPVLLLAAVTPALGGQAVITPLKDLVEHAALVAIVDVTKVTAIDVPTGNGQVSTVYVAEAEVVQTLKSDQTPDTDGRRIAVVGSTVPRSSAAWQPIESKRYLAFLNPEQGHYRYGTKYAMRPVSPQGTVPWYEKNSLGIHEFFDLDVQEAVKKIMSEQDGAARSETGRGSTSDRND